MTFLSTQSFDENGEIKVVEKKRKVLETVDEEQTNLDQGVVTGKARVKFEYKKLTADDIKPFHNLVSAETHVLTPGALFGYLSSPPMNGLPEDQHAPYNIKRALANIATMTKGAFGNVVVYHPSNEKRIEEIKVAEREVEVPANPMDPECEVMVKEKKPYFAEGAVEFVPSEYIDDDVVLAFYRGIDDGDQPLIYVDGHGLLENNTRSEVRNYGKFVDL